MDLRGVAEIMPLNSVAMVTRDTIDHLEEEELLKKEILQAWDDVTGAELNPDMVQQARAKEMAYARQEGAWRNALKSILCV